ncbi:MAG: hypothetical protein IPL79_03025 [Myxococcales bacterium]|nr:hypothetical protein [Myxococcales bacterium]
MRARQGWAAVAVAIAVLLAMPRAGAATPTPAEFDGAMKAMLAGDLAAAQRGFEAVAGGADAAWADDGLREAARVAELRGRYGEAQAHYRELIARFPESPYVRHAEARLGYLARIVGEDAAFSAAQAEREALMQQAARLEDPAPALVALEALLRREPQLPAWPDAARWLGEQWLQQGDLDRGLAWFRELAARPGENADARKRALASALVQVGRLGEATTIIASLDSKGDVTQRAALAELRRKLASAQRQRMWRTVALVWLAGFALVMVVFVLRRGARQWRERLAPDLAVAYMIPIGAGLVAMSYSRQPMVAAATLWIVVVATLLTWVLGCALRTKPRQAVAFAMIGGAVIAAAALVYVAVTQDRLIDMLIETWRYGHDPA